MEYQKSRRETSATQDNQSKPKGSNTRHGQDNRCQGKNKHCKKHNLKVKDQVNVRQNVAHDKNFISITSPSNTTVYTRAIRPRADRVTHTERDNFSDSSDSSLNLSGLDNLNLSDETLGSDDKSISKNFVSNRERCKSRSRERTDHSVSRHRDARSQSRSRSHSHHRDGSKKRGYQEDEQAAKKRKIEEFRNREDDLIKKVEETKAEIMRPAGRV